MVFSFGWCFLTRKEQVPPPPPWDQRMHGPQNAHQESSNHNAVRLSFFQTFSFGWVNQRNDVAPCSVHHNCPIILLRCQTVHVCKSDHLCLGVLSCCVLCWCSQYISRMTMPQPKMNVAIDTLTINFDVDTAVQIRWVILVDYCVILALCGIMISGSSGVRNKCVEGRRSFYLVLKPLPPSHNPRPPLPTSRL